MSSEKKKIISLVGSVMVIMLLGKVLGFVREMFLTSYFGAGSVESGAYNTASLVPNVFLDIAFASAISSGFIPIFNSYLAKDKKQAFRLASNFINIMFVFSAALTAILMIFAPLVTNLIAGQFNTDIKLLTVDLLRIMLPTIVLSTVTFSLIGVLQSLDEFNIPAAVSIFYNLVIIFYYQFFIEKFGVYGLAAVVLVGWVFQILIQLPSLKRKGYHHSFVFSFKDEGFRQIIRLTLPVMVSSWLLPINLLVNNNAASRIFGGLSTGSDVLRYAYNLYSVITGVIILSISNVVFQLMSKQQVEGDHDGFAATIKQSLRVMSFILIPLSLGLIVLGKPIIALCYERRNFDAATTALTYDALKFFAFGMLGFGFQTVLSRGFYALKNGRVPMITSLIGIAVNAALSYFLAGFMGIGGPALASSVAISAAAVIMLIIMQQANRACFDKSMIIDLCKVLLSAAVMAVVVMFVYPLMTNGLIALVVSVVSGVLVYAVLCYLLKVTEMKFVTKAVFDFLYKVRRKGENKL